MIPQDLQPLFWDVDQQQFDPLAWPEYVIFRVLEYGDDVAARWMRETFSPAEIRRIICTEARLSPRSANFWALVYGIPVLDVAALNGGRAQRVAPCSA